MNDTVNDTIPFPTLTGAMALLGPLLLLTSTVVFLVTTGEINHGAVGGAVSAWAAFALMFAFIGIALKLVPRAPRGSVVVLFIPSREIDVPGLPLISDVLLVAAFAPISVVLLRSRAPLDRPTES